ncbi:NADP-dependent oxidoreductase [Leifsonia sp. 2TAF2]|uniref:NADP-dependent oxidoreductase n=1 Tax=Leifsonia sp. 2TAF2 TaxID=3233009 RepID=UPI003F9A7195
MKAITVSDAAAGAAGMRLDERPHPHASENDVIVRVHAAGFTPGELSWPATWTDRAGRDRTPTVPGHELAGVVTELGYGTTGLTVGQRVFGLADWTRDGTLAEYVAVEARNLAPLPADIDFVTGASLPISGLTAWQGLFLHGGVQSGQTVLVTGAAGGVGSVVVQLARAAGARVIGVGRAGHRSRAEEAGAHAFAEVSDLAQVGEVDVVFDVLGGELGAQAAALVREGGTLISIAAPPEGSRVGVRSVFFVVEPSRAELVELVGRVRRGELRTFVGAEVPLSEAPAAFSGSGPRGGGKTIVRVAED